MALSDIESTMQSLLLVWSATEYIAASALAITVLGLVVSMAWWCSALYSRVQDISEKIDEIAVGHREELKDLEEQVSENHEDIVKINAHIWPERP